MIPLLLALAAPADAPAMTPIEAERAFAEAAARDGQWTAFRTFAAPTATMFVPQPVKAQDWLKDRKDPARSVRWQAAVSYVSCDGKTAVNTGNWQRPDGSFGYFTTVWQRQPDGSWKWLVDSGDVLKTPRREVKRPLVRRAACHGTAFSPPVGVAPPPGLTLDPQDWGLSGDGTLLWRWQANPDGRNRALTVEIVTGPKTTAQVIADRVQ